MIDEWVYLEGEGQATVRSYLNATIDSISSHEAQLAATISNYGYFDVSLLLIIETTVVQLNQLGHQACLWASPQSGSAGSHFCRCHYLLYRSQSSNVNLLYVCLLDVYGCHYFLHAHCVWNISAECITGLRLF